MNCETFSQKKKSVPLCSFERASVYTNSRFAVLRACSRELLERMRGCVLDCSHTRVFNTTGNLSTMRPGEVHVQADANCHHHLGAYTFVPGHFIPSIF